MTAIRLLSDHHGLYSMDPAFIFKQLAFDVVERGIPSSPLSLRDQFLVTNSAQKKGLLKLSQKPSGSIRVTAMRWEVILIVYL